MELYLHLKRDYKPAEYLSCVKDHKLRKTLTKYRLSDHCLAIERGRHRQRWQPREQRLCSLCSQKELETEEHFLLHCDYYHNIRAAYFPKFLQIKPHFMALPNAEKLSHILGENSQMITTAAVLVSCLWKRKKKESIHVLIYLIILQIYSCSMYYIIVCSCNGQCFGNTVQVMPIKLN